MISLLSTIFLAQRSDWLDGAIILGIAVLTMIGSLGKWIVKQIAEKRERTAKQREGMSIDPARTPGTIPREQATIRRDNSDASNMPPFAAPMPPVFHRTRNATTQTPPPVMERVMEVLLERATGAKLERRVREMMPQPPAPPPPPAARSSEHHLRKQTAQRTPQTQKPTRSITIAEREANREQTRQTEVELETQRLTQREQRFTDDTDQRLGHVVTHIAAADVRDSASADAYDIAAALDDPDALRRAFILSEILAPPLALRGEQTC